MQMTYVLHNAGAATPVKENGEGNLHWQIAQPGRLNKAREVSMQTSLASLVEIICESGFIGEKVLKNTNLKKSRWLQIQRLYILGRGAWNITDGNADEAAGFLSA